MAGAVPSGQVRPVAESVVSFVAVGSNIEPERNIARALQMLQRSVTVEATSTFYRTAALGRPEQDDFLNGVWQVRSGRGALELKRDILREVERRLGRVRDEDRYAARPIDLDLILHGEAVVDEPGLRIPDPEITVRAFIAVPLLELRPGLVVPGNREPLSSIPAARRHEGLQPLAEFTNQLRERIGK
jgi:dihydroneopterin aldolase/2-amino-4-hydroxy-6-hydroxymethyldihydropteridine diphosphokinase